MKVVARNSRLVPKVTAHICAARHPRIVFYEKACPLCAAAVLLEEAIDAIAYMRGQEEAPHVEVANEVA